MANLVGTVPRFFFTTTTITVIAADTDKNVKVNTCEQLIGVKKIRNWCTWGRCLQTWQVKTEIWERLKSGLRERLGVQDGNERNEEKTMKLNKVRMNKMR